MKGGETQCRGNCPDLHDAGVGGTDTNYKKTQTGAKNAVNTLTFRSNYMKAQINKLFKYTTRETMEEFVHGGKIHLLEKVANV